jgi:hypothetical protein
MTDDTPRAARRYEAEEEELIFEINAVCSGAHGMDDARTWLVKTLSEHRMDAYQAGHTAGALEEIAARSGWWDRNWVGVAMLAMIVGGMVLIGLVNGWS